MPKTKGKKKTSDRQEKSEFIVKESGLEYAQAGRMLGNGRLEAICFDGHTRLGHIRGKMLKRVWINTGDILLVALRDFQDNKVDIVHKYSVDHIKRLKSIGEIPNNTKLPNEVNLDGNDSEDIEFVFDEI